MLLGRVLSELQKAATAAKGTEAAATLDEPPAAETGFLHLPDTAVVLTPGIVSDAIAAICTRKSNKHHIAPSSLHMALSAATSLLSLEPTVVDLTGRSRMAGDTVHVVGDLHGCGESLKGRPV